MVEVETAKAIVDVPCPYAGRVRQLHGEPGQMLAVGAPLMSVATVGSTGVADDRTRSAERRTRSRPPSRSTARRSRPAPATC